MGWELTVGNQSNKNILESILMLPWNKRKDKHFGSKNRVWCKDTHFRSVLSFLLSKKREVSFHLRLKMTDIQWALNFHFSLAPRPHVVLGCATLPSKRWHAHTHTSFTHNAPSNAHSHILFFDWVDADEKSSEKEQKKPCLLSSCQICGFVSRVDSLYSGNKWFWLGGD